MSEFTTARGGSTTMILEEPAVTAAQMEKLEASSAQQLLVAIDVAERSERVLLMNTIKCLVDKSGADEALKLEYVRNIILIGFKRRNHEKSQATGTGSGEKDILRTILVVLYDIAPDLVKLVLPLVPLYGSYKDLNVMAERYWQQHEFSDSDTSNVVTVPAMCNDIVHLFAEQLTKDHELCASANTTDDGKLVLPSNACKYVFTEFRHKGSKKNRIAAKASRGHKLQRRLADAVADRMFVSLNSRALKRPAYRKCLSALRNTLTEGGFMIEKLMCERRPQAIIFERAPKGSLEKYKAAINKNEMAKGKWLRAASKNLNAVADIDELSVAVCSAKDEENLLRCESMVPRKVIKAINSATAARATLVKNAQGLLDQLLSDGTTGNNVALPESMKSVIYPVVDTFRCNDQDSVDALLLAAYIVAKSQCECNMIVINGNLIVLPSGDAVQSDEVPSASGARANKSRRIISDIELENAMCWYSDAAMEGHRLGWNADEDRGEDAMSDNLKTGGLSIARHAKGHEVSRDIMLLCKELPTHTDGLESACAYLQNEVECPFRSVLVHKLQYAPPVDFTFRAVTTGVSNAADMVVDVCFFMDLTGSMGSWMNEAKSHIANIVKSLQVECNVKNVRVSFVGYRDYRDTDRVVVKDFVDVDDAEELIRAINDQEPSGGGDFAEDVLSGVVAVNKLTWEGDVRICLQIADAPAHGYCDGRFGDDYPSGTCPDQEVAGYPSLDEAMKTLANANKVDFVFCECSPGNTDKLIKMIGNIYYNSAGFGVLKLSNASTFNTAIMGALKQSLLKLIVADDVSGLQSFCGTTLSSIISTMNSSARESLNALGEQLMTAPQSVIPVATSEEDEMACDRPDEEAVEMRGADEVVVPRVRKARSDYERLVLELSSRDLHPIRLVLGCPLSENLALAAGKTLLDAGITVRDLQELGYPPSIIQVFVEAAGAEMKTV